MTTVRRWLEHVRWVDAVIVGGCAILVLILIHYVTINRGNLPYLDEWYRVTDVAQAAAQGSLTFDLLTSQWNEHRPLVVNLITAGLTVLTGWDISLQLYIHVGFALVLFGALLGLIRTEIPERSARRWITLVAALPIAMLIFAVTKRQVWLWPYLLVWTQGLACFTLGLYLVRRLPIGWFGVIAVIVMAAATTYSLIYGFAAWVLLAAALWLRGYRKPIYYIPLVIAAALVTVQFFSGFDWAKLGFSDDGHGSGIVRDPARIVYFIFANLGNPFFPFSVEAAPTYIVYAIFAGIGGAGLLIANVVYVWRRTHWRSALWTWGIFAAFAAACVGVIALGRAGQVYDRPHYALAERYSQPAALLWVTLLVIGAAAAYHSLRQPAADRFAKRLLRVNIGALAVGVGMYAFAVTGTLTYDPYITPALTQCAIDYPQSRNLNCLMPILIPGREPLPERVAAVNALTALRLSVWRDNPPPYDQIIPLTSQPYTVTMAAAEAPTVEFQMIGREFGALAVIAPATSQVEFTVTLPETTGTITFRSVGVLDLDGIAATALLDGVTYRIGVRLSSGMIDRVFDAPFLPTPEQITLPIGADLSSYQGQQIDLLLQVDGGAIAIDNRSLWIDPRIEIMTDSR